MKSGAHRAGVAFGTAVLVVSGVLRPGVAQAIDPVELTFWRSIEHDHDRAEYQAYLDAYPNGRFAPFVRGLLAQPARGAPVPDSSLATVPLGDPTRGAPDPSAAPRSAGKSGAWVRPTSTEVVLVDGVTLDMDARALRDSSNLRLAVVPAGSPDAVGDANAFLHASSGVPAARMRVTIPSGPPGSDEVRLYHIPRFAASYAVGARAPVTVSPGLPGVPLARDLAQEAARLGPLRFEANHRGRPMLIQAAFLRARAETEWNLAWFGRGAQELPVGKVVVISVGQPNVMPDLDGSLGEAVCVLSADDNAALDRIASLQTGDPVAIRGVPTTWSNARPTDPVVMHDCSLAG